VSGPPDNPHPELYRSKIDRRTALTWLGWTGTLVGIGARFIDESRAADPSKPAGYGLDPNLVHPERAPWPRILSSGQLQAAAILADFILPATADMPSACALGVPDFIDEWISAPYPEQVRDRPLILDGLAWLDSEAARRQAPGFLAADGTTRSAVLDVLTREPPMGTADPRPFFRRFRYLVVGAYYTTSEGFKDIGYIGNVARPADPGPSNAVKARLERELGKLGL
jgi:Gluconate 2-dehydrogenase subunit 3